MAFKESAFQLEEQLPWLIHNVDDATLLRHSPEYQLPEYTRDWNYSLQLFKTANGDYQVMQMGTFRPVMGNLIDYRIAEALTHVAPDELAVKPVRIFRRATGEEWLNYRLVKARMSV